MPMRREQVAAALKYLGDKADLRGRFERATSLDPQEQDLADIAVEGVASLAPGVGPALAARDFERARRADDKAGMAMAAASAIPVNRLIGALKGFDPVTARMAKEVDYRGQHKAPTLEAASADDLTKNGIYPNDVYMRPDWYESGDGLREMWKIRQYRGNPDASLTIYRAIPKDVPRAVNQGDWVTTSRKYAKQHGESALNGDYKIVSKKVRAKDIFTKGDSIFEWGYNPSNE